MQQDAAWERYGRAVITSMSQVLEEAHEDAHAQVLETADYWLSLGLAIALRRPVDAERLLAIIVSHDEEPRSEIEQDADAFCAAALA